MKIELSGYDSKVELEAAQLAVAHLIGNYVEQSLTLTPPPIVTEETPTPIVTEETPPEVVRTVSHGDTTTVQKTDGSSTTTTAPTTGDLVANGVPWDKRIHAGTKTTIANGDWKRRKNVPDATYQQVLAEITAGATEEPTQAEKAAAKVEQLNAAAASNVAPDASQAFGNQASPIEWDVFFERVVAAQIAGTLAAEQIASKVTELGVDGGLPAMVTHPELYERFLIELNL